ncbi:MAG: carboxypeptidase regulatory-like domain-containing protein, partial [Terriglobia bacterium]
MKNLANYMKRSRNLLLGVAALLGMAMCSSNALAQSGAGSIQGTVTDSTGAVIPGASIKVVNQATGVAVNTVSNKVGFYQAPDLFTGSYSVTTSAAGFEAYRTTIELLVAQSAVINPVLTAGAVTQQVVVSGNAVQLTTTDSGAITSTLENARINQLPMNGRSLATLVGIMTPGLESNGENIDGMKRESLDYVIDGVTTQNALNGGEISPQQQMIDPDAVQEVTMEANNASAQYASPATAIVTTKSGTDSLHGTFFETARNNGIGLAKNRQDPSNYSAPPLVRNEFGASAGGPIVIPHVYHGRDKSFWFFAYERFSQAASTAVLSAVPTMDMRQGNFSGLTSKAGVLQTLFDPATTASSADCPYTGTANSYCRTAFSTNQIPTGEESPLAKVYYALLPNPTSTVNPLVQDNLDAVNPTFEVEPQITFRLDHEFNQSNRAYLRLTQNILGTNRNEEDANVAADGIPAGAAVGSSGSGKYVNSRYTSYLASIDYTHVFSPTLFAETNVSQQWLNDLAVTGVDPQANYESKLGLPNNFGEAGFPLFSGPLFALGTSQTGHTQGDQIISTLDENLTKTVGRHQIMFGGRYRHERLLDLVNNVADTISITGLPTALYETSSGASYDALPNTGYADASLFLGSANAFSVNLTPPVLHFHVMEFDGYFQDNYHVSRNLTLNLGLRYEYHPGEWTKHNLLSGFDLKNDAQVLGSSASALIAGGYTTQAIITNMEDIGVKFETPAEAGMPSNLFNNYERVLPR